MHSLLSLTCLCAVFDLAGRDLAYVGLEVSQRPGRIADIGMRSATAARTLGHLHSPRASLAGCT